ncbi:MAG TPA: hypothetical protein VMM60_00245 [Ilumatobacter sp.]|nr:hypothetical protein [Ilumatobacter sp.]
MPRGRRTVVASSLALFVLAGCGGSDDPPAAADESSAAATDAESTVASDDTPAAPASEPPSGGGLGMGAETWARQLKVALRADDYTVDGNTVTLMLGDGVAADGESACGVAAATSGTNVAVVLSYPDGDVAC